MPTAHNLALKAPRSIITAAARNPLHGNTTSAHGSTSSVTAALRALHHLFCLLVNLQALDLSQLAFRMIVCTCG